MHRPLGRFEHNYSEIAEIRNLQTIKSLHFCHDCLLTYKIKNHYMNSPTIESFFYHRQITYSLRNFRVLRETTHAYNIGFYSTINRLRRSWITFPRTIINIVNIASFKRAERALSMIF